LKFVNRHSELTFLKERHEQDGFQFIPIYGRRRVGKTRLLREFLRDRPGIYFMADTAPEREQLKSLGREVGEFFQDNILAASGFQDWQQVFAYLKEKSRHTRLVLALDEFPYLVGANSAISSIFQKGVDLDLQDSRLMLLLTGSSMGMMEEEVLHARAPLYGRRTGSLEVKEMPFETLAELFPDMPFAGRVSIYSLFGAIPAYLERVIPTLTPLENIRRSVLDRGSFLYSEVEFLLREELREPRNYFVILRAIAQGKQKLSEIINDTGMDKSHVSRYLDILRSLRLVEKEVPVTEKYPDKSRAGLYRLHDRFFTFWFRYVFPFRGRLEIDQVDNVLEMIAETFDAFVGNAYEDICRAQCLSLMKKGVMAFTTLGRWWERNEEIDIVALDETENVAWFGECKWSRKKVGTDIYEDLVRKSRLVSWRDSTRFDRYVLFSRSGFTEAMVAKAKEEGVVLIHGDSIA